MNLTITESNPTHVIARIEGRFDTAAAVQFGQDMDPLLEQADKTIVLDCEALEFVSSSGLRCLLTLRKAAQTKGGQMIIRHVSENVKHVFDLTGFTGLFVFE